MRSKWFLVAALSGTLVVSGAGSALAKGPHGRFSDLGHAQWAASAIEMLSAQGILNGLTPTEFGPQQPITIGQLAAILLRYEGSAQGGASFDAEVSQAAQDGMMSGLGGNVGAGQYATRAQAMAMIVDALHLQGQGQLADLSNFRDDHGVPGWARNQMALAVQFGLLAGSQGYLLPGGEITRAELAVILQRIETDLGLTQANATTLRGTFQATGTTVVNGQPLQTITLSIFAGTQTQQTYTIAPNAQIDYGNQAGAVSSFQVSDQVMVTLDQSGEADAVMDLQGASSAAAHAGSVAGTVTAIGNGQISVSGNGDQSDEQGDQGDHGHGKGRGQLPPGTYTLSPAVKVVIPGEGAHGSVSQVAVGEFVRLVVGPSGLVDMIIVSPQSGEGGGSPSEGTTSNVSASEISTGIALSWPSVSGATSYQVFEASGGSYAQVASAQGGTPYGTSTTITGLSAGTSYTFEVEAVGTAASSPSAPSSAVEWGARSETTAAVGVTPSGSDAYVTIAISYDKVLYPASLDTAVGDYAVTDATTDTTLQVAGVTASGSTLTIETLAYPVGSLASDLIQVTTAKSVVEDAAGAPTTPIDATGTQSLAVPSSLSAQETAGGIVLSWTGVAAATSYQVLEASGGAYAPVEAANGGTPTGTTTAITGLSAGTNYTFEVEAIGTAASSPSAPSSAVEWGAKADATAATTVTEVAGEESFTIAIPFDKALSVSSLDTTLGDYQVTDATTHQTLGVASVSVVGQTLIVQTVLGAPLTLTDGIQVTTSRSVVNDTVGAPTAPIDATSTL